MEGIITTNTQNHAQPNNNNHHLIQKQQQLENEQWQQVRQTETDRHSREATLRHPQPYIETERLRQQQQQIQQLQQQYRFQQQRLSQEQKRLSDELEWIHWHQQKQAAANERQRRNNASLGGREEMRRVEVDLVVQKESDSWAKKQEAQMVGRPREPWELILSTKEQMQAIGGSQQPQNQQQRASHPLSQYRHHQTKFEQPQSRQQPELEEGQHRENQELWDLYQLRKQQEQETFERRQKQQQQQQQQQEQQQALLSNKLQLHQQQPSPKMGGVYSGLIESEPSHGQESNKTQHQKHYTYNRPLIPAPQNWVQSTFTTNNSNQDDIENREDEDVDELDEDYQGQYYNQQAHNQQQHDWRDLRRLNKVYVPLPRRKRGRKGRGDLFEDDYHAGFNKIEIQALSTVGKAAYEAQRQKRQHHDAHSPPPFNALED